MTLRFERDGSVAHLILDRPEQGNAINMPMARALLDAALTCEADPSIRCVLLTGRGRMFCVGGDISGFAAAGHDAPRYLAELAGTLHAALQRFAAMQKPLITAINGPAAGAGMSLAIAGDLVFAAKSAHFTAAYTAIGLTPDGGMTWLLPRLVGLRHAQDIILTNRRVSSEEACMIGLVTGVMSDDTLLAQVKDRANQLAVEAVGAVGSVRALLQQSFANSLPLQLESEARAIAEAGSGREAQEGIAAFLAKRRPSFFASLG